MSVDREKIRRLTDPREYIGNAPLIRGEYVLAILVELEQAKRERDEARAFVAKFRNGIFAGYIGEVRELLTAWEQE